MSVGPKLKENRGLEVGLIDKTRYVAGKALTAFFVSPVHYLFYGLLSLTSIGLLLGREFSWQLYAILITLGLVKVFISQPSKK